MSSKKSILCVDDDPDDVHLLQEALRMIAPDFALLEATDGKDALERLGEMRAAGNLPCLVVLDINMPRMDGKETFLAIRSDEVLATVPIVIFSTSNSMMDKLFFQKKNVEYITKPIRFATLLDVAGRLLQYCK